MGESIEEAKEILDICKAKKLTAGVNFQLRQAPYMIQLRKMISDGLIGDIYDVDWKVVTLQPWHLWTFLNDKERCEINYHSIHYVDAIRSICGDPKSVYCKTMFSPKSPNLKQTRTSIIMDYGDYLRVNISTNHGHDYGTEHQESYLQIEGTKGAIRLTLGLILDYPEGRQINWNITPMRLVSGKRQRLLEAVLKSLSEHVDYSENLKIRASIT